MSRNARLARAGLDAARTHHIDAVAHHFLSADGGCEPATGAPDVRDVAIAAPGCGRAAACVAAGLAAAARVHGWGSGLVEDDGIAWSAFSWLSGSEARDLPALLRRDLPAGVRARWLAAEDLAASLPERWLRWRLLGEATAATVAGWEVASGLPAAGRAAAPRWECLVWCAAVHEAAQTGSAATLERLVSLLDPLRVEFLVVPEAWDARPGAWRLAGRRADPGWRNLAHLQEVARTAAGPRPVAVRMFPDAPAGPGGQFAEILAEVIAAVGGRPGFQMTD